LLRFDAFYGGRNSMRIVYYVTFDYSFCEIQLLLFSDSQRKDPFDEKKVMMKFRTMLKNEDFESLFRDPLIGDFM
jgi:hypothetical protein